MNSNEAAIYAIREAYARATELLNLCSEAHKIIEKARTCIPHTADFEQEMGQWSNDFLAYLKIQTEGFKDVQETLDNAS